MPFCRNHRLTALLSLLGLILCLHRDLAGGRHVAPRQVTPLFVIDGYALFYMGLIFAASIAVLLLSYGYLAARRERPEEFYLLVLVATLGAAALVASDHFASFFLGLETLSISLLGLIAYPRDHGKPLEAGVKYLILAGISSAFLLFGMALVYARLGIDGIRPDRGVAARSMTPRPTSTGSPALRSSSPASASNCRSCRSTCGRPMSMRARRRRSQPSSPSSPKARCSPCCCAISVTANADGFGPVPMMIEIVAIASILVGNLLALLQNNLKRILAYSSIAHLGYLLVAFLAGGALRIEAVTYYLVAYAVMTLGAFGIITVLSASNAAAEIEDLDAYRGLFWRRPWLGGVFAAMLLSLAGIPLTMGFIGKFYAIAGGISAAMWPAVIALIVGSVIGLFYYLRVIVAICTPAPEGATAYAGAVPMVGGATLVALTLMLFGLGVYPTPLVHLIQVTAAQLVARYGVAGSVVVPVAPVSHPEQRRSRRRLSVAPDTPIWIG